MFQRTNPTPPLLPFPDFRTSQNNGILECTDFDTFTLKKPADDVFNFETMMVDPENGTVYLVSRTLGLNSAGVYSFQPAAGPAAIDLDFCGPIPYSDVVSGDMSPDGRVLLKTTRQTLLFFREDGESVADTLSGTNACLMEGSDNLEYDSGIAFTKDQKGYFTIGASGAEPVTPTVEVMTTPEPTIEVIEANSTDSSHPTIEAITDSTTVSITSTTENSAPAPAQRAAARTLAPVEPFFPGSQIYKFNFKASSVAPEPPTDNGAVGTGAAAAAAASVLAAAVARMV